MADLITFPSIQGNETQIQQYFFQYFRQLGVTPQRTTTKDYIKQDPEYKNDASGRLALDGAIMGKNRGCCGFLPNKTLQGIKTELKQLILEKGNDWLRNHCHVEFSKIHNNAYEITLCHPLVETMKKCCQAMSLPIEIAGWSASCDARLFNKVGHMPVLVFGPGRIGCAHSAMEQININEIITAAKTLVLLIQKWCI